MNIVLCKLINQSFIKVKGERKLKKILRNIYLVR